MKIIGHFFIRNYKLFPADKFQELVCIGCKSFYEVLRIFNGGPVFLEEHLSRLLKSAKTAGVQFQVVVDDVFEGIKELCSANRITAGNIKLEVFFDGNRNHGAKPMLHIYFIPHVYPDDDMYHNGVTLLSLIAERDRPNAKITNLPLRSLADQVIKEKKVFEVLLVNQDGLLTEGSRSNIFFIRDGILYTPPTRLVLPGITREKVEQICSDLKIPVQQKLIPLSDIGNYTAAFLSGTSPGVLQIAKIDNTTFDPGDDLIQKIMDRYDEMVEGEVTANS